ncbi:hypothetical protein GCM10008170_02730 [Methylopila capsulata]|uniref:Uncharacterized protein n=1 Tax=Methylopila capsulata TaxID=61654 RepID=A0A9W6MQQ3_9HYPH|nr:hypothetical protein GCM10008170_02730 [Methylopila capsulata]
MPASSRASACSADIEPDTEPEITPRDTDDMADTCMPPWRPKALKAFGSGCAGIEKAATCCRAPSSAWAVAGAAA